MDYTGTVCKKCGKGTYRETSIYDDLDGTLHCSKCGHGVYRYGEKEMYRSLISRCELRIEWATKRLEEEKKNYEITVESLRKSIKELEERLERAED